MPVANANRREVISSDSDDLKRYTCLLSELITCNPHNSKFKKKTHIIKTALENVLLYIRVRFVYIVFHFIFRLQFNLSFFNVRTVFKVQRHKQKAKFKNKAVTQCSSYELTWHVFLLHLPSKNYDKYKILLIGVSHANETKQYFIWETVYDTE